MARIFYVELEGNCYSCKHCGARVALEEHIISKTFRCMHGRAYLFDRVWNVSFGEEENRMMITGSYTVVEIYCVVCGENLGWKYVLANDQLQNFKQGKYVLAMFMVWEPDGSSYVPYLDPQLEEDGNN